MAVQAQLTRVVNLKYDRYDVYIGRPGKGQRGPWGNPIKIGARCCVCGAAHEREGTIACYRVWLARRMAADPIFREAVKGLTGKVLGCFCKPQACHGDVLAEVADALVAGDPS